MTPQNWQKSSFLLLCRFFKPYGLTIFGAFLALSLAASTVLFLGQGLRILIDQGFSNSSPQFLNQALMTLLGLVFILAVASFARSFLSSWLGEKVCTDIRLACFEHLLFLAPTFYKDQATGNLQSRLHTDTSLIQILIGGSASTGLRSIIQFTGALILLFYSNLKLAALSCLIIPILVLPLAIFGRYIRQESRAVQHAEGKTAGYSLESLTGIQTIQAYNQQHRVLDHFQHLSKNSLKLGYRRILAQSSLSTAVIFLAFTAVSILLWYGSKEVFAYHLTSGELISFIFYAIVAAGSINSLSLVYSDWQRAMGACSRIQDLLSQVTSSPEHVSLLKTEIPGKICFENITFTYPGLNGEAILKDFSLQIKRGETVALIGPSGAGKTTVFNLLLRFFTPDKGQIFLEDIDIQDLSLNELRNSIGWVPQDPMIFADTVANNIRFSNPDATDDEVKAAAQAAYAADFIEKLPHGFETPLEAEGHVLSSGQKQRVAIARAILKDPAILLLDEATNALDSESEFQVQKALDNLMKGRTTVLVAHRLSTVLKANRLIVLDHGKIISAGSHTSLMRNCATYRRFVSLQFEQPEAQKEDLAINHG